MNRPLFDTKRVARFHKASRVVSGFLWWSAIPLYVLHLVSSIMQTDWSYYYFAKTESAALLKAVAILWWTLRIVILVLMGWGMFKRKAIMITILPFASSALTVFVRWFVGFSGYFSLMEAGSWFFVALCMVSAAWYYLSKPVIKYFALIPLCILSIGVTVWLSVSGILEIVDSPELDIYLVSFVLQYLIRCAAVTITCLWLVTLKQYRERKDSDSLEE